MRLVTVAEMRAIEREGNQRGVSYDEMMERAGRGVAVYTNTAYSHIEPKFVLGLVGSGNNGGDTLIALETLAEFGWTVCAYLLRPRLVKDPLIDRVVIAGGEVINFLEDDDYSRLDDLLDEATIILDGVLGTGIKLPLKEDLEYALSYIADFDANSIVIAVDCPSGIDCDSGEVSPAVIPAELTLCMDAIKIGLVKFPAFEYVGHLDVIDLGLPEDLDSTKGIFTKVLNSFEVKELLPDRPIQAHKGIFGTAMIAAGSLDYTGAALLAGEAAYRIGTGLVRMAVPGPLHSTIAGQIPEATWLLLPDENGAIAGDAVDILFDNMQKVSALLVGPGIGITSSTKDFIQRLLLRYKQTVSDEKSEIPPLVLDADALKLISDFPDWYQSLPRDSILTPHPGEMSILTGLSITEIQKDRITVAKKFASMWGHIVVLKGALSVIAAPDGRINIIPIATPALARAGTGDVLAGLITGLRAQGIPAFESAVAGAWVHGHAGLLAAELVGQSASVLAGDVLASVPLVLAELGVD